MAVKDCFKINCSSEYFEARGITTPREIQVRLIDEILAIEVSIYACREVAGCGGHNVDILESIRNGLINIYEEKFSMYAKMNDPWGD